MSEGEKLYNLYKASMELQNTGVDDWEDLDSREQQAWDGAAADFRRSLGL